MSTTSTDIIADVKATYYKFDVEIISPLALLYYDYILTFNTEVLRIWSPLRCNLGTVLFLLNRYVVIFGYIPIVAELFIPNSKEKQCYIIQTYHQCLSIIIQGIVTAVMIVRVHALWERSRVILTITLVFSVISIAFGMWCMLSGPHVTSPTLPSGLIGCRSIMSSNQALPFGTAWSSVLLFDAMVFGLTMYKTLKIGCTYRRTVVDILLRDGSMYFAVMGTMMLVNVLVFFPFTSGMMISYTNVLASICSARLMLNIRDPKIQWPPSQTTLGTSWSNRPYISTIVDIKTVSIDEPLQQNDITELLAAKELGPRI